MSYLLTAPGENVRDGIVFEGQMSGADVCLDIGSSHTIVHLRLRRRRCLTNLRAALRSRRAARLSFVRRIDAETSHTTNHAGRRSTLDLAGRQPATSSNQGGYIFYAGASLAGAGYCRRPAILPLQLWQGCQVCVKLSAQRLPRVAQFYAC